MDAHEYRDRVHGCWLGKNIGGTIGGPYEGKREFLDVPREYPSESIANDDLDLQLVWLLAVEKHGAALRAQDLAEYWRRYVSYPFDEYGVALKNIRLGLQPPATGHYDNWFRDSMGSPIRSEIWACLFPGEPERAAFYALQDSQVDHWGEGVYGEIFLAALESRAFVEADIAKLVDGALAFIPGECKVARAVRLAADSFGAGRDLRGSRDEVLSLVGHHNFTDCAQNIAFTVLGLLHGKGALLDSIVLASNCGYDVDCTAATAGAIAGALAGGERVTAEAGDRLDERIVPGWGIEGAPVPGTITELTDRTVAQRGVVASGADVGALERPFALGEVPTFEPPVRVPWRVAVAQPSSGDAEPDLPPDARAVVSDTAYPDLGAFAAGGEGALLLQTTFTLSGKRTLRTLSVSSRPVRQWVDGALVLDDADPKPFLPATHRTSVRVEPREYDAGSHRVTIEVRCGKDAPPQFAWIVADEKKHWAEGIEYGGA